MEERRPGAQVQGIGRLNKQGEDGVSFQDLSGTPRRRQGGPWEYIIEPGPHRDTCIVKSCAEHPMKRIGLCVEHWYGAPKELKQEIIEQGRDA